MNLKPGDLFIFETSNINNKAGQSCIIIKVYKGEFQIDEIGTIVEFLKPDGTLYELAYNQWNGKNYLGMQKIRIINV